MPITTFSANNKTTFSSPIEGVNNVGGLVVNRTNLSTIGSASLTVTGPTTTGAVAGNIYGAKISGPVSGSGLLASSTSLFISKPTNSSGTTTNAYSLYVEKPTVGGTLNYSVYSEGSIFVTDSIVTGSTSFDLINTIATEVNFAKAATTLSIGASGGTTTFNGTLNVANGSITGAGALTFTAGGTNTSVTFAPNGTGTVDVSSKRITNVATPTASTDAANKGYVDSLVQGIDVHPSVQWTTNGNINLTGTANQAGLDTAGTLTVGNRILVKNQTVGLQNGIYVVSSGSWTRATDFDSSSNVSANAFFFVEQGTEYSDTGWTLTNDGVIAIGTDALTFTQFSGAGAVSAGDGLTKTGSTLNVVGTANRISVAADSIDISSSYVGQSSITTVGTISSGTWSGSFGAVSGANLTSLTAGNLSGTISSGVLGNSTVYIGTTGIALNRASGDLTLGGITLTTPNIGAATATSVNKLIITAPANSATLTIADGKIATINNTLTFTGTDNSTINFGSGGTILYSSGNIGASNATSLSSTGLVTASGFVTTDGALGINFKDGIGTAGTASGDTRLYTNSGELYIFANGGSSQKVLSTYNIGSSALAFGQSSLNNNTANGVKVNAGIYTMRMSTASTNATKMTVSGAAWSADNTDQVIIPANTTWATSIKIIAYNAANTASASWDIVTTFKRGSGGATMVADPIVSAFGDGALDASTIDVTCGSSNNILISVTSEVASTTLWAASITTLEVS